ncbi:hypothetical protein S40285_00970 [Stachybotrys chlorohalonatus IBT 40285]|uniref:Uncharacterized protein n=1 Tax=Stachybotrys chlorohalonatus (strain IBT 40285) TaxID=1283841 RepID=A0A084QUQ5_STAC4|nr:hypothetical protein S40285_00970 [Stachybotrys chlorohalonata IBT 40285]
MFKSFTNLTPRTRLAVGVGAIAWGFAGLYLTEPVADKLGYTPTEKDKAELDKMTPHIITVERRQER